MAKISELFRGFVPPTMSQSPLGPVSSRDLTRFATTTSARQLALTHTPNLTASAAVLTTKKIKRLRGAAITQSAEWQREAWAYYDTCPELAYVTRFEAAAMSRANLVAAKLPDAPDQAPEIIVDPADPAAMAMSDFLGGRVSQTQEIARIDTHMTIAGISHIVAWDEGDGRFWTVLSNEEISWSGSSWRMRINGEDVHRSPNDTIVIRVWNPHGRDRWVPDSPVRHLLPILAELEGLTKHVSATIDSRLAGAGVFVVPNEVDFPVSDPESIPDGVDPLTWEMIKVYSATIENRDTAAALVPIILRVPGEMVDKVRHIQFFSDLDSEVKSLREEAIRRVALGLDIPPEILLGMAPANHWTSWQIEESSIKLHIEPKLQTICHAATVGYLHPYLKALNVPDWFRYACWYDVTQIKLRPNRAADAKDLHSDFLITDEARRKAAGFDEKDKPDAEQLMAMILRRVASQAPQLAEQILPLLGVDIPPREEISSSTPGVSNQPATPADNPTPDTRPDNSSSPPDGRPNVTTGG